MDKKEWKKKIAERSDMTINLIHLTKPAIVDGGKLKVFDVLVKILKEKKLEGSTTESGFIVGDRKAVCFQDVPVYSLSQNIYFEQKLRMTGQIKKCRYLGVGLLFKKDYIYNKGGRPVVYDKTQEAKNYLPKNQWWRIVNLDLSNEENFIDWTHEREWRIPEQLNFELGDISIIVPNEKAVKKLVKLCNKEGIDILNESRGIINLGDIFY
ncbi:DUF2971 domain-containing protein [Clostridium butyricum]|uniref:DUF2971 domain-containing protein n=1 Tax=Clostridium butyricum TaxID=1492 RepID=UPI00189D3C39|nr:DUF2971 domain-containing protein [Clostridium butyricum]MDB2151181.1 DUF2971 domain-containing protein [Clostridium butyricum]